MDHDLLDDLLKRIHVPDGVHPSEALWRADRIVIGTHPDDIEILGIPEIRDAFGKKALFGICVTDGASSPRQGRYKDISDATMAEIRRVEQRKAAEMGEYSGVATLGHPSAEARCPDVETIVDELSLLIGACRPRTIVTHQPFDHHATHCGVMWRVVESLRRLSPEYRPQVFQGREVWGTLDFLPAKYIKVVDATDKDSLLPRLLSVYDSQCAGGKRYDVAVPARFADHRTFADPRKVDEDVEAVMFALDLMPLLEDPTIDQEEFLLRYLRAHEEDVLERNRAVTPVHRERVAGERKEKVPPNGAKAARRRGKRAVIQAAK